jgi:hypothetical protein
LKENVRILIQNCKDQERKIDLVLSRLNRLGIALMNGSALGDQGEDNRPTKGPPPKQFAPFSFSHEDSEVRSMSQTQNQLKIRIVDMETVDLSLLAEHTSTVQSLVLWPSVKALIPEGITPSYVIDEETGRDLLRLDGHGQGGDQGDYQIATSPDRSSPSDGRGHHKEGISSPSGLWGSAQLYTYATYQNLSAREHPGEQSNHGGLILDSVAVDRCFRNFMNSIYILHPFLEPKRLRNMISTFKREYSWNYQATLLPQTR